MDYSNPLLMRARRLGGALGILRPIVKLFRRARNASYEERFEPAFIGAIRPSDTVWDLGANVGVYLPAILAAATAGKVVAIEPSPRNFRKLSSDWRAEDRVILQNLAISDVAGRMPFYLSNNHTTDGLSDSDGTGLKVEVEVCTADELCRRLPPDVVKIDVEGYELEVIQGSREMLEKRVARSYFIEVHFQTLADRGLPHAPQSIVGLLAAAGYDVRWLDPSHLRADLRAT